MRYFVKLEEDSNNTFLVSVADIPGALTFGETKEEALLQAVDAIETMIMAFIDDGKPIPLPKSKFGYSVTLSAQTAAKVALWNNMVAQGMHKAGLAKKLGWHLAQVRRVLDPRFQSSFTTLQQALRAVDLELQISAIPMAA